MIRRDGKPAKPTNKFPDTFSSFDVYLPTSKNRSKMIYGVSLGILWEADQETPDHTTCTIYVAIYPRLKPLSEKLTYCLKEDNAIRGQVDKGYDPKTGHYVELYEDLDPAESDRLENKLQDIVGKLIQRKKRIHKALSE